MKLMFPDKFRVAAIFSVFAFLVLLTGNVDAQKRNSPAKKSTAVKKATPSKKETASSKKATTSKKTVAAGKKAATSKKSEKQAKDARKDQKKNNDRVADNKAKKETKKGESKKAAVERRRREEERRLAILAEQRRREQARREAIARRLAFERGLRTETIANISNDNTEGEDLRVRAAAIDALGSHAGSVVVMEAQTGKVLTIVNQDWAVRKSIRPCSTIKLITAAAGLNEGVISKEDGSVRNMSTRRNLDDALAFSDNPYFQRVGSNLGNEKLVEYGKQFGLGEPTGVNIEGETAGRLPYANKNARIYSHGDDTEVSTIQLAVMASALTNGGKRVLPRIPRNSVEQDRFQTFYKANVELPQQNVRRVIPGMMGAAEYGTARRNMDQTLGVAGKTGSCIDKGSWVGLFTSVAPIESPKYAVAVITRGPSERGRIAAGVAAQVYRALSGGIVRTDRNLAQTEFKLVPKSQPPVLTTAAVDEDEDEASEDAAVMDEANADRNVIVVPSAPRQIVTEVPAQKKLVHKTVQSRPLFPPVVITTKSAKENKKRERVVKP